MPKITVLIPVYNRAHYIDAAIDSVLAQTCGDYELLVVDDGSTDDSVARVRRYDDPRIRVIANECNRGIAAARNRGIDAARGEYLAFLDSDDFALPQRLDRQARFLDTHADHAGVGGFIEWIDAAGKPTGKIKRKAVDPDQVAAERLFRAGLENSTAMTRTAVLRAFDHREDFALGSDYDLWARIAAEYRLSTLPEVLVYRREHDDRASHDHVDQSKGWRLQIFAAQLDALGMDYAPEDLERHYLLRRMHKTGFTPDAAYVDWSERWLLALQTANRRAGLYPEPDFTAVLAGFWLKTCWNAASANGQRPWRRFWRSPLRSAVPGAIRQAIRPQLATMPVLNRL
ncbi:family 2 glycosyl transferase [Salinisphaera sp. T5B8]|uniref:glycosyltransferase family 2 protein n=1 Tax=Salinisphaera sp. T5B8 TaxID=1304154 RepID=UPI00333F91A8